MLVWLEAKGQFPPLLLLRRYLKLVLTQCENAGVLDLPFEDIGYHPLAPDILCIPTAFPQPSNLVLFVPKPDADTAP